jgi:hypothetical protein
MRDVTLKRVGVVALSITVVLAAAAVVYGASDGPDPQSQTQAPPPPKQPPPPLFPKHRRGLYKNAQGIEVIDATPQSPPLGTDDPGVPDKGEYEINLTTGADLSKDGQSFDLLFVDANYGILPKIAGHELPTQVKFECPLAAVRGPGGDPFTVGVGASTFGLKFNFFTNEHAGISISVYPQLEFETPGTSSVEKGLAEPGQTFLLPLLLAKEFHYLTLVANGALHKPVRDSERETTGAIGVGVGRAFTRKVAAMIELREESTLDFAYIGAGVKLLIDAK